jgi:cytochrome c
VKRVFKFLGVFFLFSVIGVGAPIVHASEQLMQKGGCISCHRVDQKLIGPGFKQVAAQYKETDGAAEYLFQKVREGGEGVWGDMPMQPNGPQKISDEDLHAIVAWILRL